MSLFFNFRAQLPAGQRTEISLIEWHSSDPLLAVATANGQVMIFGDEGDRMETNNVRPGCVASCVAWHPTARILAMGWRDGAISWWSEEVEPTRMREAHPVHAGASITCIRWLPPSRPSDHTTARLITADSKGGLAVWRLDSRGRLTTVLQHRLPSPVTAVEPISKADVLSQPLVRRPRPGASAAGAGAAVGGGAVGGGAEEVGAMGEAEDLALRAGAYSDEHMFVCGCADGSLLYADDIGHCHSAAPATAIDGTAIAQVLLWKERCGLVVTTVGGTLAAFIVQRNFQLDRFLRQRLAAASTAGDDADAGAAGAGPASPQAVFVAPGLLATAAGEPILRVWSLARREEAYQLNVLDMDDDRVAASAPPDRRGGVERLCSISFNPRRRVLAGATRAGRVVFWQLLPAAAAAAAAATAAAVAAAASQAARLADAAPAGEGKAATSADWEAFAEISLDATLGGVAWGPGESLLAARLADGVPILHETVLKRKLVGAIAVAQLTPESVAVEHIPSKTMVVVKTGMRMRGLDVCGNRFCVFNGKAVELYEVTEPRGEGQSVTATLAKAFAVAAHAVALSREGFLFAKQDRIEAIKFGGQRHCHLAFADAEGTPTAMDLVGDTLATVTSTGFLKLFRLSSAKVLYSRRLFPAANCLPPPPRVGPGGVVAHAAPAPPPTVAVYEPTSVRVACDSSRASVLSRMSLGGATAMDSVVRVVSFAEDAASTFDFGRSGRTPISHTWDAASPRVLAVETRRLGNSSASSAPAAAPAGGADAAGKAPDAKGAAGGAAPAGGGGDGGALAGVDDGDDGPANRAEIVTMFSADGGKGLFVQDAAPMERAHSAVLGVAVPLAYFFLRFKSADDTTATHVDARPLRDFEGVGLDDGDTKAAVLDFSYSLAVGDRDGAVRAVRRIKEEKVWRSLAALCVKTRRLDVAELCLANMQDAVAMRALRDAIATYPERDAHVATLAVQLWRVEDAERLLRRCRRFDLLVALLRACGRWERAISTAEASDRIHLRSTHYAHARYLEACGDFEGAIRAFERAQAHRHEVPRMLFDQGKLLQLEQYVQASRDSELVRWWAQYCESIAHFDLALSYYAQANDVLSCVRLHCFLNNLEKAAELVHEKASSPAGPAAAYHLARQYEDQGRSDEAISFFSLARAYRHAIRLAKDLEREGDVMSLALLCSRPSVLLDAAEYLERRKHVDKAVRLYQKGGAVGRALQLCKREKLFGELNAIADHLDKTSEPHVLLECAAFFAENGQHERAVKMAVAAGACDKAIELCAAHSVKLTEEMADELTPTVAKPGVAPERGQVATEAERVDVLNKLATLAKQQEAWHLACKKFNQAGDRVKAMRMLLRSGHVEDIVFFAQHSRTAEIFVLAANFLQNQDWHGDGEDAAKTMKTIIQFYTKAQAYEQLSTFYEAAATYEINDYRDYDKAALALGEARKALARAKTTSGDKETRAAMLKRKIDLIERFAAARRIATTSAAEMTKLAAALLEEPEIDEAVRIGDIYALMIEAAVADKDMQRAYKLLTAMREKGVVLSHYLKQPFVQKILRAVGVSDDTATVAGARARMAKADEAHDEVVDD